MPLIVTTVAADVVLVDLGGRLLSHPTVGLDLEDYYASHELQGSVSLREALQLGTLSAEDGNGSAITDSTLYTYAVPLATESNAGKVETADQVEVNSGSDDARYVTPKKLNESELALAVGRSSRRITVALETGKAQYQSVGAACLAAAALTPTATDPIVISVAPGRYVESPFTVPRYVTLTSQTQGMFDVVLVTNNDSAHFVTMSSLALLGYCAVEGPVNAGYAAIRYSDNTTASPAFVDHVLLRKGYYGILNDTPTGGSRGTMHLFFVGNQYSGSPMNQFIRCTGKSAVVGILCNFMNGPSGAVDHGFVCDGAEATMTLDVCAFRNGSGVAQPVAVMADNGAQVRMTSCSLANGHTGLHIGSGGTGSKIICDGSVISYSNFTNHIKIDSATGVVQFSGSMNKNKLSIVAGGKLVGNFSDSTTNEEGVVVLGELYLGTPDVQFALGSYVRDVVNSGLVTGGALTRSTGRDVSIAPGRGWLANGTLISVEWDTLTATIPAGTARYIAIDANGAVVLSATHPVGTLYICLGLAAADATDIVFLSTDHVHVRERYARLHEYLEEVIGPVAVSGCTATKSLTALKINVDAGEYYLALEELTPSANTNIQFTYWYKDGSGGWTAVPSSTVIDDGFYDDGSGTLAAIIATKWKRDLLFVSHNESGTDYHVVYGQELFDDQTSAEVGNNPVVPDFLRNNALRVAAVVIQVGSGDIASLPNQLPRIGAMSSGTTAVTDHGGLSGLGDDDHTQYLRIDGTRAATGALNMGGFGITNVGNVDGVDVSSHASRHNPGQIDAIATAPASTITGSSAEGSAASVSRSDHDHAIGTNVVGNTHLADVPTATIKGRATAGTGDPEDLTAAQARTVLDVYTRSEVDTLVDATLKAPEAFTPAGSYPTTYGGDTVQKGDSFRISAAGTMGTITVNAEDLLIALIDSPGQTDANWMVAESNRDQATETTKGVAEIATQAETEAGADDSRIVTPAKAAAAYLKRSANDFSSFANKDAVAADLLLIEDSEAAGVKKRTSAGAVAALGATAYEASATNTVTTTSLTKIPRPTTPVTITPPAGKYLVVASIDASNNNNNGGVSVDLRVNGVQVAHTNRASTNTGPAVNGFRRCMSLSAVVTVDGTQPIALYVSSLVAGTASFFNTTLNAVRVQ